MRNGDPTFRSESQRAPPLMSLESRWMDESPSTFLAAVGLFTSVDALVDSEVTRPREPLSAFLALEGFRPSVSALVVFEVARLREAFTALLALEGLRASVNALVRGEVA